MLKEVLRRRDIMARGAFGPVNACCIIAKVIETLAWCVVIGYIDWHGLRVSSTGLQQSLHVADLHLLARVAEAARDADAIRGVKDVGDRVPIGRETGWGYVGNNEMARAI